MCSDRLRSIIAAQFVLAVCHVTAWAGPLSPPSGPITSTGKTLTEVEPRIAINAINTPGDAGAVYRIIRPGSYYLTRNVVGAIGQRGIEISASNVTVDLQGFVLIGSAGSLSGISAPTTIQADDITIRNGTITGWGQEGINLRRDDDVNNHHVVENVLASSNSGAGIRLGSSSVARHCIAVANGGNGFFLSYDGVVEECISTGNTLDGFKFISGVHAWASTASSNGDTGIDSDFDSRIDRCIAVANLNNGIATAGQATRNNASGNGRHGLNITSVSRVIDNLCAGNALTANGAGIALDSGSVVEHNTCPTNRWGIRATGNSNWITQNLAGDNTTNWDIGFNNFGLFVLGANAPAFSGNTGGTGPGSTDPNANFTH